MTPLSYDPLNYAAEFSTEMCPEGVVAVSGEKLRIFGVDRLGEMFNQAALPLRYVTIGLVAYQLSFRTCTFPISTQG